MSNEQVAPETKGVTVKLLATVDLGPEIEGMAGRQLRMRMVTIEPGGVFGPIHDRKGYRTRHRLHVLQGTITDHRNGVATDYGPGVGWPEDRNTTHWLEKQRNDSVDAMLEPESAEAESSEPVSLTDRLSQPRIWSLRL